jgi:hypothetical protein
MVTQIDPLKTIEPLIFLKGLLNRSAKSCILSFWHEPAVPFKPINLPTVTESLPKIRFTVAQLLGSTPRLFENMRSCAISPSSSSASPVRQPARSPCELEASLSRLARACRCQFDLLRPRPPPLTTYTSVTWGNGGQAQRCRGDTARARAARWQERGQGQGGWGGKKKKIQRKN